MAGLTTMTSGMTGLQFRNLINNNFAIPQKVFNVVDYGAVHDGVTDDTASIQSAIMAADVDGGGVIYFPKGIYVIGGAIVGELGGTTYNSQLTIPYLKNDSTLRKTFHFLGEVSPNMDQSVGINAGVGGNPIPPSTGVILKSTIVGDADDQSVICGGYYLGTPNLWTNGNSNYVKIENIQIHPVVNGDGALTIGGVNMRGVLCTHIKNVCCYPFNKLVQNTGTPINNCIGIAVPQKDSGNHSIIEHTTVGGFRVGYLGGGDHTVFRDTVAMACYYGYQFTANNQICLGTRMGSYWCAYDLYFTGINHIKISELQVEWYQDSKWYDTVNTILDASDQGRGEIHYSITEANVGFNNAKFSKSGGAKLQCYPIAFDTSALFTVSGARDNPEEALASLLTALAAKGIIVDGTTAS